MRVITAVKKILFSFSKYRFICNLGDDSAGLDIWTLLALMKDISPKYQAKLNLYPD